MSSMRCVRASVHRCDDPAKGVRGSYCEWRRHSVAFMQAKGVCRGSTHLPSVLREGGWIPRSLHPVGAFTSGYVTRALAMRLRSTRLHRGGRHWSAAPRVWGLDHVEHRAGARTTIP